MNVLQHNINLYGVKSSRLNYIAHITGSLIINLRAIFQWKGLPVSEGLPYSSSSGNLINIPCCGVNFWGQTDIHDLVWKFQSVTWIIGQSSEQNAHFIKNMIDVFFQRLKSHHPLITQSQYHQQCQLHLPPPHGHFLDYIYSHSSNLSTHIIIGHNFRFDNPCLNSWA